MTEFLPEDPAHGSADAQPPARQFIPPPEAPAPAPVPYPQQTMYAAPPTAGWDPPQSDWGQQPPKKRKAWPWILGIVGGLVVLGGVGVAVAIGVDGMLNADQNDNYTGAAITAGDSPTLGDKIIVSDSGVVAFEANSSWIDSASLLDAADVAAGLPVGASITAVYFTSDPATSVDDLPRLVMVVEGAPEGQVGSFDVKTAHAGFFRGLLEGLGAAGVGVTSAGPDPVTTANGLDGLVSTVSGDVQGLPMRISQYTFARGQRGVFVEIISYDGVFDEATAALVTDTLRIDK